MVHLFTPRFYLRRLNPSDASINYLLWFRDPTVIKFIKNVPSNGNLSELKNYIELQNNSPNKILLGIFTIKDNFHIGNIKFDPINHNERFAVLGVLIGAPEWRSCGVFNEILCVCSRYLNEIRGIDTIILGVDRLNTHAIHAYVKSGFHKSNSNMLSLDSESVEMCLDISQR